MHLTLLFIHFTIQEKPGLYTSTIILYKWDIEQTIQYSPKLQK